MTARIRPSRLILVLLTLLLAPQQASAETSCDPFGVCHHFIPRAKLPKVSAQQTMVWCWAAAAQIIFRYYGHDVPQPVIVKTALGTPDPKITTGAPDALLKMLNASYTDSKGKVFTVSTPKYSDTYPLAPGNEAILKEHDEFTNADMIAELSAEHPIFYGDGPHAMVLVDGVEQLGVPVSGWVLDPAPIAPIGFGPIIAPGTPAVGLRQLMPNEMHAFFAAQIVIN